jgi:cytochrome P450
MPTTAPGPTANPFTGQLKPFESDPLRYLTDVHRTYGDVVRLRLWPHVVHLVSHPDDIRHVLVTHSGNFHDLTASALRDAAPKHLQGRALDPAVDAMLTATGCALGGWTERARSSAPFDLATEMRSLALDVLGRAVFGVDDARLALLERDLEVASHFTAPHRSLSMMQRLERSRDGVDDDVDTAVAALRTFAREVIDRRRTRNGGADLVSQLVGDDDGEAVASLLALLIAGHESTASALTWTLLLLADHPTERAKVTDELERELQGRAPRLDDLPRLRRTRMALQEALRLFPPVWVLAPRVARDDDEIRGYTIPAGSAVIVSPWVTHRDPSRWSNPEVFDPERFVEAAPEGYLPFGAGPWGCVGSQFGMTEARIVLAMILQRFVVERCSSGPIDADPRSALWPADARVVVSAR